MTSREEIETQFKERGHFSGGSQWSRNLVWLLKQADDMAEALDTIYKISSGGDVRRTAIDALASYRQTQKSPRLDNAGRPYPCGRKYPCSLPEGHEGECKP